MFLSSPGFGSIKGLIGGVVMVALAVFVLNQFAAGRNILAGRLALN
jgi:hypothetical protein